MAWLRYPGARVVVGYRDTSAVTALLIKKDAVSHHCFIAIFQ